MPLTEEIKESLSAEAVEQAPLDPVAAYLLMQQKLAFQKVVGITHSSLRHGEDLYRVSRFKRGDDQIMVRIILEKGRITAMSFQAETQRLALELSRVRKTIAGRESEIQAIREQILQAKVHYKVPEAAGLVHFTNGLDRYLLDYERALAEDKVQLDALTEERQRLPKPSLSRQTWEVPILADLHVSL